MELKKDDKEILDHRIVRAKDRRYDIICKGEIKPSVDGKFRADINMSSVDSQLIRLAAHFCRDEAYQVVALSKALKEQILTQGSKYLRRDSRASYKCSWTIGVSARGFDGLEAIRGALRSSRELHSSYPGGVWRLKAKYAREGSEAAVELRLVEVEKL